MIEIRDSGPPLNASDIKRVEALIDAPLPPPYREFLLEYNGGIPKPSGFPVHRETLGRQLYTLEKFYPVIKSRGDPKRSNLEWIINIVRARKPGDGLVPRDTIPIGSPMIGELLLFVSGMRTGEVWFKQWDGYGCEQLDTPMAGMYYIAPSFDKFLEMLEPTEWD